MSWIGETFRKAGAENRAAFVAYLTCGDPSPEATVGLARALERAGADILELGVPFSDPIADGPVLQRAAERALAGGTDLDAVFAAAKAIKRETALALVLFSYLNPLLHRGVSRTARDAREAGFDGVILTDVPPEESGYAQPAFQEAGLDTVFLVSPTSGARRMGEAARLSRGFLYVVSRPGTTGARAALPPDLPETVRRARKAAGRLPVAIGFGIATPEAARQAAALADGVVVGSSLVRAAHEAGAAREKAAEAFVRPLVEACRR